MNDEPLYEKIIHENEVKGEQLRLVVSEFRGEQYVHLRKYFLSYEGDYIPTKEGATMVASIQNIYSLLDGLLELCSLSEGRDAVTKHFADRINEQNSRIS